jgi:hypothetical protein
VADCCEANRERWGRDRERLSEGEMVEEREMVERERTCVSGATNTDGSRQRATGTLMAAGREQQKDERRPSYEREGGEGGFGGDLRGKRRRDHPRVNIFFVRNFEIMLARLTKCL